MVLSGGGSTILVVFMLNEEGDWMEKGPKVGILPVEGGGEGEPAVASFHV